MLGRKPGEPIKDFIDRASKPLDLTDPNVTVGVTTSTDWNYRDVTIQDIEDLTAWFCSEILHFAACGRLSNEAEEEKRRQYIACGFGFDRVCLIPYIELFAEILELFAEGQGIPGAPIRTITDEILDRQLEQSDRDKLQSKLQDAIDTANRIFTKLRLVGWDQGSDQPAFPSLVPRLNQQDRSGRKIHQVGFHVQAVRDVLRPDRPPLRGSAPTPPGRARHALDYRSVIWYGHQYTFTANQAACVRILWESWKDGTPEVGDATVLEGAEIDTRRLRDVFRGHPAWGSMIVKGKTKGTHRLSPPQKS